MYCGREREEIKVGRKWDGIQARSLPMKDVFPRKRVCLASAAAALLGCALLVLATSPARACPMQFQRGDADSSGTLEITDPIKILGFLFLGTEEPSCLATADVNDDDVVNVSDPIHLLGFLFLGTPPPPEPYGSCGGDLTGGVLPCYSYPPCSTGEVKDLFASYGILRTIAGSGTVDTGRNGWQESFEGGPATAADLSTPHMALGDADGNIYIADKEAHAIRKVTPDGKIHTIAGMNTSGDDGDEPGPGIERHLSDPNGIWLRADGTLFILDTGNAKVRRLSTDGVLTTLFQVPGLAIGRGLWVSDAEDLAYVSSANRLLRWTPGGGVENFLGVFVQLGNLVVDRDGNIIVTDRGDHRVYRVTPDRQFTPIAGNGSRTGGGSGQPALETGLNGVRGVWLLDSGAFFVATHAGSQVWYVDTKGIIHLFLDGSPGNVHSGDGEPFDAPGFKVSEIRSVAMDPLGNLLIAENDFGYIRMVEYVQGPPCK
jgi:hypothetical protein